MNIITETGTTIRSTGTGMIAVRGKRELYFIGTSVTKTERAKSLLAAHSFDRLFKAGKSAGAAGRNVRYIAL